MGINIERLKQIAVPMTEHERKIEAERDENREARRYSALIALAVRRELRIKGLSQQAFAEHLGVSPQYFGKILKGNENLTLETIGKIERVLGRSILKVLVEEEKPLAPKPIISVWCYSPSNNDFYSWATAPNKNKKYEYAGS